MWQVLEPILSKLLNSLSRFCHEHLVVKHPQHHKSFLDAVPTVLLCPSLVSKKLSRVLNVSWGVISMIQLTWEMPDLWIWNSATSPALAWCRGEDPWKLQTPKLVGVQLHPFRQGPAQVVPEPAKVRGNTKIHQVGNWGKTWEINHSTIPSFGDVLGLFFKNWLQQSRHVLKRKNSSIKLPCWGPLRSSGQTHIGYRSYFMMFQRSK